MTPEALKNLKDQLIGMEPSVQLLQQTGGTCAQSITVLHSVLAQLLHSITPEASPATIAQPAGVGAIAQANP